MKRVLVIEDPRGFAEQLELVRQLGIHPIAGGDGETPPVEPPAETPPAYGAVVTPPAEPPAKTAEQLLAEEREESARLRGRLEERAAAPPPTAAPAPRALTVDEVEAQFRAGEITDLRRIELISDLRYEERRAKERTEERRQEASARASSRLGTYISAYPALKDAHSPLMDTVREKLGELQAEGLDPRLASTQVLALDALVAAGELAPLKAGPAPSPAPDPQEHHRRRIPVGGGAPGGPVAPTPAPSPTASRGERIFAKLAPEHQQFYIDMRGSKELAIKTLEHADEDMLRRNGRLVA